MRISDKTFDWLVAGVGWTFLLSYQVVKNSDLEIRNPFMSKAARAALDAKELAETIRVQNEQKRLEHERIVREELSPIWWDARVGTGCYINSCYTYDEKPTIQGLYDHCDEVGLIGHRFIENGRSFSVEEWAEYVEKHGPSWFGCRLRTGTFYKYGQPWLPESVRLSK